MGVFHFFKIVEMVQNHAKHHKLVTIVLNPLSANVTKWSNTSHLSTNCLSVFDHFVGLALKGLNCSYLPS